jgi:hypothetical protein
MMRIISLIGIKMDESGVKWRIYSIDADIKSVIIYR